MPRLIRVGTIRNRKRIIMTTATRQKQIQRPSELLDGPKLIGMLEQMMLIRRFEERCAQSYQQAKIGGFCHLYIGQEAVAVGSIAALNHDDPIITAYRDHGHALARGMPPKYAMAELFGKITGCSKGKGGSMHFFDRQRHMYGGHAIVGGQCPLGVGLAFGIQYNGEKKVCICSLGDGALNQGAFHESMNLAAIWKLPIIFLVENNNYSMGTHIARGTAMAGDLCTKAASYGVRSASCNGMDVLATYDCVKELADEIRFSQDGPAFIDCQTYRYKGHSMSDPQKYRTRDEVATYEKNGPINALVTHLINKGIATQEKVDQINRQAKEQALAAVKYADESPEPSVEELFTDVYSQPFGPYTKGELPEMLSKDAPSQSSDEPPSVNA